MLVEFVLALYLYKAIFSFFFLNKGDKFISLTTTEGLQPAFDSYQ